ncbi:hypothetical protein BDB00DRAFT_610980 [Zychaea mexicana]|uniref:uncharacterized protein n=1 Tax=Zychaea mexicana TaxID=64656 RepID=UPI0022FEC610|nr:uncharacterized protein BDB00DRAFT_610980 [Zychaea mexicana]KAI9489506.1 hypothetical protein BDB00DRAFT_610980 [Zychaea mexicana]
MEFTVLQSPTTATTAPFELSHYRPLMQSDLEQWRAGCLYFDNQDYDSALRTFMRIGDNARMHFNIGLIFGVLQDYRRSVAAFKKSLEMDPFFAVACFQRGVAHFALGDLVKAYEDFDQAHKVSITRIHYVTNYTYKSSVYLITKTICFHKKLRGNPIINYHQLGLSFRLYECEVLFNRGICQLYLGRIDAGLTDLYFSQKAKLTEEHEIIDQAVRDRGRNYSVYSIPPGALFRPSEKKMEQMRQFQVDYNQGGDSGGYYDEGGNGTGGGKRQNSVLLPPSAPWMQEVARTDATFLAVPQPQLPLQPIVAQVLEQQQQQQQQQQRPPSPEELDPFMFDPVQLKQQHPPPFIQTTTPTKQQQKKKTYDPENAWKVVDRRATLKKDESSARRLHRPTTQDENYSPITAMMVSPVIASSDRNNNNNNNAFPIPAAQDNQADYTGTLDTMSYYGDDLDEELDRVYASLNAYLTTNSKDNNSKRSGEARAAAAPIKSPPVPALAHPPPPPPSQPSSYPHLISNNSKPKKKNIYKHISQQPSSPDAKIKIKVHYHDTRILLVPSDILFTELLTRVRAKFNVVASQDLRLQYKDEENVMVLMIDQDDLNMARYLSRSRNAATSKHPTLEKLELWCISTSSSATTPSYLS